MQRMREEFTADVQAVREVGEKTQTEVKENRDAISNLKSEMVTNKQQLLINTNNISKNLNRINTA